MSGAGGGERGWVRGGRIFGGRGGHAVVREVAESEAETDAEGR